MRLALIGQNVDHPRLAELLQSEGIVVELAQVGAMVLLFGEDFTKEKARILTDALRRNLPLSRTERKNSFPAPKRGACVLTLREALFSRAESIPVPLAAGRVAAEIIGLYPPGTALCLPGEVIDEEVLVHLTQSHVRVVTKEDL